ncbi:putative LRR receptor-like serine/threonine-protein kinase [Dichanthelium oligosanthes]|uniref:non-specific serine/threonine protein kinase n=1 Tax=Dichanthelium oligosanthes TaxID=888268 RepID=A0A1E5WMH1_9POAL|nr:putative LRR receptor-like serine/threonine-protein kinase [Dichanthelium oligosanthes]
MRHRNLLRIVTICSSIDSRGNGFKAILYDFMPNGSLEGWIHQDTVVEGEERHLDLLRSVTKLLDVAYALDYLHCHGPTPVVRCDIKSSNVLLDAHMVAQVGDFGHAKILVERSSSSEQTTSSMGFRGAIGYAAPEYGAGNMVTTHGDIYSYGILVMETITGKRPTDSEFTRQGLSLREYVERALHNAVMDAVDIRLSLDFDTGNYSYKRMTDCVVSLLRLGVSCTQESPSSRMPNGSIIKELLAIKDSLVENT